MAIFLYVVKNSITFTNEIWICKGHIPNSLISKNTEEKDQEMSNYGCTDRKGRDIATQKKNEILTANPSSKQRKSKSQGKQMML